MAYFSHKKSHVSCHTSFVFVTLVQKFTNVIKRTICQRELVPKRTRLNTHVLFFRRNFHTTVTKRNSSAMCTNGILWNNFFKSRHILRKSSQKSGFMEVARTKRDSEYFLFSGLTFSQICAHCSSEWLITSSNWQNWREKEKNLVQRTVFIILKPSILWY